MESPKDFETRQAVVRIALRCKQTVVPLFLLIHVLSIVSSKLARTLQTLLLLVSTLDCYIWIFIYFWHWPDVGYITIQAERKASSSSIHPSSSHAKNHAKPTATLPSSVAAAKPTASSHASDSVKGHVICRAFPDEKNGKISTTCRPPLQQQRLTVLTSVKQLKRLHLQRRQRRPNQLQRKLPLTPTESPYPALMFLSNLWT